MRDFRLYLEDILDVVSQIRIYISGLTKEGFARDRKTQDAVVRNLEIIGEAAGNLPEYIQKSASEIDWRKIKALRNILIHEYFGINLPIIWDVVQSKLGPLEAACRRLLETAAELNDRKA